MPVKKLCDPFLTCPLPPVIQYELLMNPLFPQKDRIIFLQHLTQIKDYAIDIHCFPVSSSLLSKMSIYLPKYIPLCKSYPDLCQYWSIKISPLKLPIDKWSLVYSFSFQTNIFSLPNFFYPPPLLVIVILCDLLVTPHLPWDPLWSFWWLPPPPKRIA